MLILIFWKGMLLLRLSLTLAYILLLVMKMFNLRNEALRFRYFDMSKLFSGYFFNFNFVYFGVSFL